MITIQTIEQLAKQCQTTVFPNTIREYFEHLFLAKLYTLTGAEKLLFKGGTALRIVYGSPRFSEDLDFSLTGVPSHEVKETVESLFVKVLADIEKIGINVELGGKSNETSGGYFGIATFNLLDYPPIGVELNISTRNDNLRGEADSIANDFVPTYTLIHLSQEELVEEKIFGALIERKKPRDFYDLYFIMRKGMLSLEQKHKLAAVKAIIVAEANKINFRVELGKFLPTDQQTIIRDFSRTIESEMNRQLSIF